MGQYAGNWANASIRNLPWRYVTGSALIWSGYVLFTTKGNMGIVGEVSRNIAKDMRNLLQQRKSITLKTLKKVNQLKRRFFY